VKPGRNLRAQDRLRVPAWQGCVRGLPSRPRSASPRTYGGRERLSTAGPAATWPINRGATRRGVSTPWAVCAAGCLPRPAVPVHSTLKVRRGIWRANRLCGRAWTLSTSGATRRLRACTRARGPPCCRLRARRAPASPGATPGECIGPRGCKSVGLQVSHSAAALAAAGQRTGL
jgi:hypothetical protein